MRSRVGCSAGVLLVVLMSAAAAQAGERQQEKPQREEPRVAYWLHCAGCHGLEGRGMPPEVPSLINEPGRIESMPGGREYLIRIPGVSQAGLDDENLAAVMNYMMYEFNSATLAADFAVFSAAELAQHRAKVLQDPLRRRSEIVAGVH